MYECIIPSEVYTGKKSHVMVVLGWFPVKRFKQKVPVGCYGVVGSLFNGELGSEILLCNLLFNSQITVVVLCKITTADNARRSPCQMFLSRLTHLKETDATVSDLCKKTEFIVVETEEELVRYLNELPGDLPVSSDRKRVIRKLKSQDTKDAPIESQFNGQQVVSLTLNDAYIEVLKRIYYGGKDTHSGKQLRELLNLSVLITNLPTNLDDLLDTCDENERDYVLAFTEGTTSEHHYGYGNRIRKYFDVDQMMSAVAKLKRKGDSLAVNMVLWDAKKDLVEGDSPCLTQIWLRLIDNHLHMSSVFRSNDMFKAWHTNVKGLRGLQIRITDYLGVRAGDLLTLSMSAHIYHLDFDHIKIQIEKHMCVDKKYTSQVGNFIISVEHESLQVTHISTDGKTVYFTYAGFKSSRLLLRKIVSNNPSIENDHLLYLADELYQAQFALLNNQKYVQK